MRRRRSRTASTTRSPGISTRRPGSRRTPLARAATSGSSPREEPRPVAEVGRDEALGGARALGGPDEGRRGRPRVPAEALEVIADGERLRGRARLEDDEAVAREEDLEAPA